MIKPQYPKIENLESDFSDTLYKPSQAAKHLGVAISTLAKWRNTGNGPSYCKPFNRILYWLSDLNDWVNESRLRSTSENRIRKHKTAEATAV